MAEILFNQLAVTLPIHYFAYAPFLNHLRLGKKRTFAVVTATEAAYLLLFYLLLKDGIAVSLVQFTSIPLFGILFFLFVEMEPGKIMFLYIFSIAYLMAVRGAASFLVLVLFGGSDSVFYSWASGAAAIVLFLATMPVMLWYIRHTAQMVFETNAPQIWKKAWLLPLFTTMLVMLFTYSPQSAAQINTQFLLARLLLIICMFMVYYFVLRSIVQFQRQTAAEERAGYLRQLTEIQADQYGLLKSRIDETRQARHDLRQHLRAIQGYIAKNDLNALGAYIQALEESIPAEALHDYCRNDAINSVLSFYAEKAFRSGVRMEISFCPLPNIGIPEPELCVILGNLLENALDACCLPENRISLEASKAPAITVRARMAGKQMLFLTVDNTSVRPPASRNGHFLSSKHDGFGNGTESVRSIAEKYHGDARFEWKDGIFFVSVMLNP